MSDDVPAHAHAHEIVIIKRHGGHEDGHHGGAWKIAFADFMTAMMAFFLVMWLISANDKTKAVIARYFNPVELVDSTPAPPGLNDIKKDDPNVQRDKTATSTDSKDKEPVPQPATDDVVDKPIGQAAAAAHDEAELTRDPYAVLAEIATRGNKAAPEKTDQTKLEDAQRGTGSLGRVGGETFRDPFQPQLPTAVAVLPPAATEPPPPPPPQPAAAPHVAPKPATPDAPAAPKSAAEREAAPAADAVPDAESKPVPGAALRAKIAALGGVPESAGASAPRLEVHQTAEGTLISLTDSADFAMFQVGSARPDPKLVLLIEKIGRLLKTQKGGITVRGYTDSRPFKSDTYDNWRLSAARANMAHYMLARGGIGDDRIDRIEGYADRHPKNAKNPEAAENRRIEILLRDATP